MVDLDTSGVTDCYSLDSRGVGHPVESVLECISSPVAIAVRVVAAEDIPQKHITGSPWRWCMAGFQRRSPHPQLASDTDYHGFGVPELRHPVEHVDRNHRFRRLASSRSRSQPVSDDLFVPVHAVLGSSLTVSTRFPTTLAAAYLCDPLQRLVPLAPRTLGPSIDDGRRLGWRFQRPGDIHRTAPPRKRSVV